MKQILLLIFLFFFIQNVNAQESKHYLKGVEHQGAERYEKAIKHYTKAISSDVKNTKAWNNRAVCYSMLKKYSKANADLKVVLELNPKDTLAPFNLAYNLQMLKRDKDAIEYYKLAVENGKKGNYMFHFLYGTAYFMTEQYEEAIPILEHAFTLDTNYSGIFNNLAWCYLEIEPRHSIRYFQLAYEKDTSSSYNVNNLGYAYLLSGEAEKALSYFKKAESMDSTNAFVYRNYGLYYKAKGDKTRACEYLQKCIDMKFVQRWGMKYLTELNDYCKEE